MQRILQSTFVTASILLILGCSLSSVGVPAASPTSTVPTVSADTPFPAPTEAIAARATDTAATFTAIPVGSPEGALGASISYRNLNMLIPHALGNGTTNSYMTDVELPYINPSNGDMPEHIKLLINGYPTQDTELEPQVEVFRAAEYSQYGDMTHQIISTLQDSHFLDGQPLPDGLPDGAFNAHVQTVEFGNGRGIRYLTQFDQAPLPVNNKELIYYYHGLTNKGDYYVQVILPVQASYLAADTNPDSPLPANAIPFNMDDLGAYFQNIADKLNATPPDDFTPSLSQLDALVQSIAVK